MAITTKHGLFVENTMENIVDTNNQDNLTGLGVPITFKPSVGTMPPIATAVTTPSKEALGTTPSTQAPAMMWSLAVMGMTTLSMMPRSTPIMIHSMAATEMAR